VSIYGLKAEENHHGSGVKIKKLQQKRGAGDKPLESVPGCVTEIFAVL
jgi:hypothetical protein